MGENRGKNEINSIGTFQTMIIFRYLFTHQPRPFYPGSIQGWKFKDISATPRGLVGLCQFFHTDWKIFPDRAAAVGTSFPSNHLIKPKSHSSHTHVHNAEQIPRCINKIHGQLETI